jgi:hypothetical protein
MDTALEIAVAALLQVGAQIWLNATLKSDVRNLTGWVKSIDARQTETAQLAAELKGRLDARLGL